MTKKLLPFAVAAALAGGMGVAQASNVTVYGKVLMSIVNLDCGTLAANETCSRGGDVANMNSSDTVMNSRSGFGAIGVRGSEDLGNGLTAMFQLEYGTNPSEAGTFGGRDQWVGLRGDFGTVRFGSISTNYKQSGSALDPFWRTSLDSRDAGRMSQLHSGNGDNGQGRATNTVRYDSPSFNGAKIVANYTLDNGSGVEDNDAFGIGLHYSEGPIFASVDYITNDNGGDDDAWKLGGKYTMDDFAFYGSYERGGLLFASLNGVDTNNDGVLDAIHTGNSSARLWHLGASFSMGDTMFYGAYGKGDRKTGAASDQHDSWTIAVNHSFSKRTSVYAGYEEMDRDTMDTRELFTVGMVHNF